MKSSAIKDSAVELFEIYTFHTGDISFGTASKETEVKRKKPRARTRERINGRKFTWH